MNSRLRSVSSELIWRPARSNNVTSSVGTPSVRITVCHGESESVFTYGIESSPSLSKRISSSSEVSVFPGINHAATRPVAKFRGPRDPPNMRSSTVARASAASGLRRSRIAGRSAFALASAARTASPNTLTASSCGIDALPVARRRASLAGLIFLAASSALSHASFVPLPAGSLPGIATIVSERKASVTEEPGAMTSDARLASFPVNICQIDHSSPSVSSNVNGTPLSKELATSSIVSVHRPRTGTGPCQSGSVAARAASILNKPSRSMASTASTVAACASAERFSASASEIAGSGRTTSSGDFNGIGFLDCMSCHRCRPASISVPRCSLSLGVNSSRWGARPLGVVIPGDTLLNA